MASSRAPLRAVMLAVALCGQLGLVGPKKGCVPGQVVGPVTGEPAATFLAQSAPQLGHEPAPCVRAFVRDLCWPHGQEALQIAHPAILLR